MERASAANFTEPLTRTDALYFTVTAATVGFSAAIAGGLQSPTHEDAYCTGRLRALLGDRARGPTSGTACS